jgi:DEAD/DEAH box helicase domain-containing protein
MWSGHHTAVATAAGSGKTLGLWLAPLVDLHAAAAATRPVRLADRRQAPTALYLSPTKALAADQLTGLTRLTAEAGGPEVLRAVACDGDADLTERRWAQSTANAVLTNPDYLHFSLLARHAWWSRFLAGLRWVLVDEAHVYRGLFGAHVALVMRRLRRVALHYGATPTFALASATMAEPRTTGAALLGIDPHEMTCVSEDSAPRGRRTVVLWRPPDMDGAEQPADAWADALADADGTAPGVEMAPTVRVSAEAEAAALLADLTSAGAQTLAFVRSRFAAESVADAARIRLDGHVAGRIASYRGGYLPEERRQVEADLRSGRLAGLVATTALELGIDVPSLDAVVIAGWPGTRASLWQQIGRAGRGGGDGLAVWIAGNNPLDTYLVDHPEAVFGAPIEATVFDPSNPHVLAPHLCAAAAELPLTDADTDLFGPRAAQVLAHLTEAGVLRRRRTGWYWRPTEPATSLTDLRGSAAAPVQIVEEPTGRLLGTVDAVRAESTVHSGAVYVHQGATFVVRTLDLDALIALVHPSKPPYRTRAETQTSVAIITESRTDPRGTFTWHFGEVEVRTHVASYTRLRAASAERLDTVPLDLPEHAMRTAATWLTVESTLLTEAQIDQRELPGALHAWEHTAIGLLPLLATCDRWDLGGLSAASHPDAEGPVVFIHDAVPGGAGFAERAFTAHRALTTAVLDVLTRCPCADGCPSCVQSPKCGNANHVLNKAAALRLVRALTGA